MGKDKEELSLNFDFKKFLKAKLKEDFRPGQRYKTFKGYKIDRWIVNTGLAFIFLSFFFIGYLNNFDLDFFSCEAGTEATYRNPNGTFYVDPNDECENPFYTPTSWKNEKFLPDGEYGLNPSKWFNMVMSVLAFGILSVILLNHFIHNGGKRK